MDVLCIRFRNGLTKKSIEIFAEEIFDNPTNRQIVPF